MKRSTFRVEAAIALVATVCVLAAGAARAEPADYVFVPYGDAGVWRLAYAYGNEQSVDQPGRERAHVLSLGVNPTARWFTSLYTGWYGEPGESAKPYAWSWLNHWQLGESGAGPLAWGVYTEIERPREHDEGWGLTWGPTLQVDADRLQFNLNLLIEKAVHAEAAPPAALKYQWQAKTLWRPGLEFGAQGFGEPGPWHHWLPANQQEHSLGPALFANWPAGAGHTLQADAALLAGLSSASPRDTLRLRLQYLF